MGAEPKSRLLCATRGEQTDIHQALHAECYLVPADDTFSAPSC